MYVTIMFFKYKFRNVILQMSTMLKCALCALTLLALVHPSYQLGEGCEAGTLYTQEEIEFNYLERFPVKTWPSVQAVHLSLKGSSGMQVQWMNPVTWSPQTDYAPLCSYGVQPTSLTVNSTGTAYSYPDGDFKWTLNVVTLNLKALPSTKGHYFFRCGDPKFGWSQVFNFTVQPAASKSKGADDPKIAIVGDWGVKNGEHTMASITEHVKSGDVQLIVHAGDISYANKYSKKEHNNSEIWVEYMNRLQPMAAHVPYMVSPGNHEAQYNFAAYLNWLKMPFNESSSSSPFWYSFDYMGIHFTSISTEHDFSRNSTQYKWIEADLKKANQNRDEVPWIMVFGHRPLYCTSVACLHRCDAQAVTYRANLEDLLHEQHVDVFMSGHNHQYERSYPIYKGVVDRFNYTDPTATVYVVNGAAGCPELNDPTFMPDVKWRAFDQPTFDTGYLLLQPSRWQLDFQYILSKYKKVVDRFSITKTPTQGEIRRFK